MLENLLSSLGGGGKNNDMRSAFSLLNSNNDDGNLLQRLLPLMMSQGFGVPQVTQNPFPQMQQAQPQQPQQNNFAPSMLNRNSQENVIPLPSNKEELLQSLKEAAAQAYPDNPNMQRVAITQALLESGLLGKGSSLATKHNNLFGIKAPGTAGSVNMPTSEFMGGRMQRINDSFGANANMTDSFLQHKNLMGKKRYEPVNAAESPYAAFDALERSGYATDPRYAEKLAALFTKYVQPLYT